MKEVTDENLIRHTMLRFNKPGAADRAIRETFGLSNARFWQMTLQCIQSPERVAGLPADLQAQCVRLSRRFAA